MCAIVLTTRINIQQEVKDESNFQRIRKGNESGIDSGIYCRDFRFGLCWFNDQDNHKRIISIRLTKTIKYAILTITKRRR